MNLIVFEKRALKELVGSFVIKRRWKNEVKVTRNRGASYSPPQCRRFIIMARSRWRCTAATTKSGRISREEPTLGFMRRQREHTAIGAGGEEVPWLWEALKAQRNSPWWYLDSPRACRNTYTYALTPVHTRTVIMVQREHSHQSLSFRPHTC